jgi:hypothetical protein
MLPQSHIAYTLAAFDLVQKWVPGLRKADYRLVALAAMGSDLVDKPFAALYFYRRFKAAVLFSHSSRIPSIGQCAAGVSTPGRKRGVSRVTSSKPIGVLLHGVLSCGDGKEAGGIVAALWFVFRNRLYRPEHLRHFLRTGRPEK